MKIKICTKCGEEKSLSEFNKQNLGKLGYRANCKDCDKKRHQVFRKNNPDYSNIWRKEHPEKSKENCKKYQMKNLKKFRKYNKKYYKANTEKFKVRLRNRTLEQIRNMSLKTKFGITLNDYNRMLEAQNGVCAICGKKEIVKNKKSGKNQNLSVDHNHQTGKIRGLLCSKCNKMLGLSNDNTQLFLNAINYLNKEYKNGN